MPGTSGAEGTTAVAGTLWGTEPKLKSSFVGGRQFWSLQAPYWK